MWAFILVFVQTYRPGDLFFLLACVSHCLGNLGFQYMLFFRVMVFKSGYYSPEVQLLVLIAPCMQWMG